MKFNSKFTRKKSSMVAEYTPINPAARLAFSLSEASVFSRREDNHLVFTKDFMNKTYIVKEISFDRPGPEYKWLGPHSHVDQLGLFYTYRHA